MSIFQAVLITLDRLLILAKITNKGSVSQIKLKIDCV